MVIILLRLVLPAVQGSLQLIDRHAGEILGAVGAVAAWMYQWYVTRFRARLKDDLEILERYAKLVGEPEIHSDPHYQALKADIGRAMLAAYGQAGLNWRLIFSGLLLLAVGALNFLVERPPALVPVVIGAVGIALGITMILAELTRRRANH
jgi:hypothetical protein